MDAAIFVEKRRGVSVNPLLFLSVAVSLSRNLPINVMEDQKKTAPKNPGRVLLNKVENNKDYSINTRRINNAHPPTMPIIAMLAGSRIATMRSPF
ncbi:MAG: hypothetical protein ABFR47_02435 [Verrucomicrobiota bacterium]